MSNANRDAQGRWSSADIAVHTPSDAGNGGAPDIADAPTAARPGSGGMAPAASIAHDDDWGAANQTAALLGHSGAGRGGGMQSTQVGPVAPRDYSAAYRSMGYSAGESAGQHQVQAGGRAGHGADVPGSGVPGPDPAGAAGDAAGGAGDAAGAAAAGGAEAAGAAAGLEELAPLALAL